MDIIRIGPNFISARPKLPCMLVFSEEIQTDFTYFFYSLEGIPYRTAKFYPGQIAVGS